MMENLVLKEKLEKLFDRLTTEIVYTAWMNRIKFKDKSISELMILFEEVYLLILIDPYILHF